MKHHWIIKWALAIGITIVLNLFFTYAIRVAYEPEPQFDQFCKREQVIEIPYSESACVESGGSWTEDPYAYRATKPLAVDEQVPTGYCDLDYVCRGEYEDALSVYNQYVFMFFIVLGVISLIGSFFIAAEAVSLGFSFGGVVALIIGTVRYWSDMNDMMRLVILAIALAALVWFGIKKFSGK